MISVKWDKNRCKENLELPSGWVFFTFRQGDQPLWCGITPNLAQRLKVVRQKAENDPRYAENAQLADNLQIESHPRAIDALIRCKVFQSQEQLTYQQAMRPSRDYAYLAIDGHRFPFVCIQDDTNDDWTYLGPWRGRFFLTDVMDTLSRILKLPYCETSSHPCAKLESGVCQGWCLAFEDGLPEAEKPDLDKLGTLLREAFLHPNNGILEMVTRERERYFDQLEFAKADLLDEEIAKLSQYRDWLNFLYATKALAFEEEDFGVQNGLLSWCLYEGTRWEFHPKPVSYRENELLAINLNDTDEARLLYEYHVQHHKG
ncbi:MAG: hypothetical protein LHW57_02600 [Candidatus Cloacimonetes bacterium]|nr:hypothetical protein [Candidatus Cloacimonadota bacterium]